MQSMFPYVLHRLRKTYAMHWLQFCSQYIYISLFSTTHLEHSCEWFHTIMKPYKYTSRCVCEYVIRFAMLYFALLLFLNSMLSIWLSHFGCCHVLLFLSHHHLIKRWTQILCECLWMVWSKNAYLNRSAQTVVIYWIGFLLIRPSSFHFIQIVDVTNIYIYTHIIFMYIYLRCDAITAKPHRPIHWRYNFGAT